MKTLKQVLTIGRDVGFIIVAIVALNCGWALALLFAYFAFLLLQ